MPVLDIATVQNSNDLYHSKHEIFCIEECSSSNENLYYLTSHPSSADSYSEIPSRESHFKEENKPVGIIKPKPREENPYTKLYCDDRDRQCISDIVKNMAEHGKFWLLRHKTFMNELGDSIRHVHPIKFMEVVFTNDHLKACMREVFDDYFKRNGFIDGLGGSLTNKSMSGDLDRYMADFAKAVKVPVESIQPFFQTRDWEGLVRYLMNS